MVVNESRTCPPELTEAVTSVLWAVPRVDNVPELHSARLQFALKYGKSFCEMSASNEELSVNDRLIEKIGITVPTPGFCIDYMEGIANEYGVEFDPEELAGQSTLMNDIASIQQTSGVPTAGRFVVPPIVVPRDDIEARLLALRRQ